MFSKQYLVLGAKGMVGSAVVRKLKEEGVKDLLTLDKPEIDLRRESEVEKYYSFNRPDYVIVAAAKVGGIFANNSYRAQFIYDNLMIAANVIHASYKANVKKLIFLGSSCIYPKYADQPIKEEYLLTGELENTNEPYAIAKIAGIKLCESYYRQYGCNFYSIMPTNLYGPLDNFDLKTSHVLPALIRKIHEAKINAHPYVKIWGTGKPKREFLFVDDLADAIIYMLKNIDASHIYDDDITQLNVGTGKDIEIMELAGLIKKIIGYKGKLVNDENYPDGTPRKLLNVRRIHKLGWYHKHTLKQGIEKTYQWYLKNKSFAKLEFSITEDLA